MHLFYSVVTVLLEYVDGNSTQRFTVDWFLPCNSVAVSAISFKPQKVLTMMVNLYAYHFLSYSHK